MRVDAGDGAALGHETAVIQITDRTAAGRSSR